MNEAQRKYNPTEKGRMRYRRYNHSEKGHIRRKRFRSTAEYLEFHRGDMLRRRNPLASFKRQLGLD